MLRDSGGTIRLTQRCGDERNEHGRGDRRGEDFTAVDVLVRGLSEERLDTDGDEAAETGGERPRLGRVDGPTWRVKESSRVANDERRHGPEGAGRGEVVVAKVLGARELEEGDVGAGLDDADEGAKHDHVSIQRPVGAVVQVHVRRRDDRAGDHRAVRRRERLM